METKSIQLKTLLAGITLVLVLEVIGGFINTSTSPNLLVIGVIRLLDISCLTAVVLLLEGNVSCIGLHTPGIFTALQKGVVWSIGFGLLAALTAQVLMWFGIEPLHLVKVQLPDDTVSLLFYFGVGGILGPVAEEIFFRGLIFRFFRRWGFVFALIFSTVIFALLHPDAPPIPIPQLVGGLLFASAFEIEKNLWAPITIHILGNLAIFSLSFISN